MALALSDRYSGPYIAANSQTVFTADWVRLDFDIIVLVDGVEASNYTIDDNLSGFEIIFAIGLLAGQKIEIIGNAKVQRDGNFTPFANYRSEDLNREFNELWAVSQELRRDVARAAKSDFGEDGLVIPPVSGNENKFLSVDNNGDALWSNGTGTPTSDFGAELIQSNDANVAQEALRIIVTDYETLRAKTWANPPKSLTIYKPNAIGAKAYSGGIFVLDSDDTISTDDGGTIIVDAVGNRWKRANLTYIDPRWFGLVGGIADATSIIQAALNAANLWQLPYRHPSFTAIVTQVTMPNSGIIEFGGTNSIIKKKNDSVGDLLILPSANVTITSKGGGFDGNQVNQPADDTSWIARCPEATDAIYDIAGLKIQNHINGIGINGDTVTSSLEMVYIDKITFKNGRQSTINEGLRDIVLGNGSFAKVSNCSHKIEFVPVGSVAASYGRGATFIGAVSTGFQGDNDFICMDNYAENYGYCGTAALGIWDFYWCGSNISLGGNKSVGSVYAPIRGKTNCRNAHVFRNSMYAPNVVSAAIAINAVQSGTLKDTIFVSENYINGFANYTASGLLYVTGLSTQAAKGVTWRDNVFVGCAASTLYQADYLDGFKIIDGSSDGSGMILNIPQGCEGDCRLIGGDYKAVTAAYGVLAENNGVMTNFNFTLDGTAIEHNGANYAIRINAEVGRVLNANITGTCANAITTRNVGHLEAKNVKMSASKTVGINLGANSGSNTTGSYDIQGCDALGATNNAFLVTSAAPTGLCRNENNSWNYGSASPTNNNLPIGTKVWNTAPAAGGAPGWMKTGATTWKAMSALAA